jgi:hypothetical protein
MSDNERRSAFDHGRRILPMFRFTIREMLMLNVLATLALAWWTDHRQRIKEYDELTKSNTRLWSQVLAAQREAASLREREGRRVKRPSAATGNASVDKPPAAASPQDLFR